jgi:hypothetical protein
MRGLFLESFRRSFVLWLGDLDSNGGKDALFGDNVKV